MIDLSTKLKRTVVVIVNVCFLFSGGGSVLALETPIQPFNPAVEFSLNEPEMQEQIYFDKDEETRVVVEKIESFNRISSGKYKISKSVKGSWSMSYIININNKNQITSTHSLYLRAISGSILSSSLSSNNKKAICSFKQKSGAITTKKQVTATITNGKLVVK
ncbi:DUF5626 family protein [Enterococcus dispar]|uniref:DUF5626 family protein n=1 Tax=Enterococcus dispar TaxID=44009 RepID=UPI00189D82AD|nr:DUF5626 family protein [Enterococcus dispar]